MSLLADAGSVEIRPAIPDEYGTLSRLIVGAYQEFRPSLDPHLWDSYAADLADVAGRATQGAVLVAALDAQPIATVSYYRPGGMSASWLSVDASLLRALAVDARYRRHGVGRMLTLECIERAAGDGAVALELMTNELMSAATHLYESMGFTRRMTLPADHGSFYLYRYELSERG